MNQIFLPEYPYSYKLFLTNFSQDAKSDQQTNSVSLKLKFNPRNYQVRPLERPPSFLVSSVLTESWSHFHLLVTQTCSFSFSLTRRTATSWTVTRHNTWSRVVSTRPTRNRGLRLVPPTRRSRPAWVVSRRAQVRFLAVPGRSR